jgi:hypothetical protein
MTVRAGAAGCAPWTDINCSVVCPHWNHCPASSTNSLMRWPLNHVPLVLPTSRTRTWPFWNEISAWRPDVCGSLSTMSPLSRPIVVVGALMFRVSGGRLTYWILRTK